MWSSSNTVFNSFKYYLVLVDDFTKFTWIFLLKLKSDFLFTFKHFTGTVENLLDHIIKILRSELWG